MDILFKERGLRIGWKSFSIYRLDSQGNTVPYGGMSDGQEQSYTKALEQAHLNSVVAAAVGWIAEQISSTPIVLERQRAAGNVESVDDHSILDAVGEINDSISWRELLTVSTWDICTAPNGSAFWLKVRSARGRVVGLEYLPSRKVEIRTAPNTGDLFYRYKVDGKSPVDYLPDEIVRLRLSPDPENPNKGLRPLQSVGPEIAFDSEAPGYTLGIMRNRGIPGVIGSPPEQAGVLAKEVADEAEAHLNRKLTGSGRGRTVVLRAAMQLQQMGYNPAEMDLSALRNVTEERVCAVLGLNPLTVALGAGAQQSRVGAATEAIFRDSWLNGVIPKQDAIMEQINRQLVPEFEPDGDYELRFDRSGVLALQPDLAKETARYSQGVTSGWMTVFDARDALGLETDDNDRYYLRGLNIVPYPADEPVLPPEPLQQETEAADDEPDDAEEREARYQAELERVKAIPPETWNGMREKAEVRQ